MLTKLYILKNIIIIIQTNHMLLFSQQIIKNREVQLV